MLVAAGRATTHQLATPYGGSKLGTDCYLISDCSRIESASNRSSAYAARLEIKICCGRSEECSTSLASSVRRKRAHDRPWSSGAVLRFGTREALAGLLPEGRAGSNTTATLNAWRAPVRGPRITTLADLSRLGRPPLIDERQ